MFRDRDAVECCRGGRYRPLELVSINNEEQVMLQRTAFLYGFMSLPFLILYLTLSWTRFHYLWLQATSGFHVGSISLDTMLLVDNKFSLLHFESNT